MLLAIYELVPGTIISMRNARSSTKVESAKARDEVPNLKAGKRTVGQTTSFHRAVRDEHKNQFGRIYYI